MRDVWVGSHAQKRGSFLIACLLGLEWSEGVTVLDG